MNVHTVVDGLRARGRRAWVVDVAVALVVLWSAVSNLVSLAPEPLWLAIVGVGCMTAPVLVRRIWPIATFAAVVVTAVGFGLWEVRLAGTLALPVALYTVAALRPRREAYICAGVLEVLAVIAAARLASKSLLLPLVLLTGVIVAALGLGLYTAIRRAYTRALVDRAERLEREREQADALAAAAERARIAREMHDIVAHHLTVMVALSDGATRLAEVDPARSGEAMAKVSATGREALRETRRLLGVLNDDGDRAGSEPAGKRHPLPDIADLDTLVEQVRAAGQAVDFSVDGQPAALATDAQLAVYRLVQEALTNTMKHAPAGARAAVALSYGSHSLELRIDDDGAGEPSVDRWRAGRGVSGMRARVQALGGQLETGPRPGSGWRVTARLPLDDTERTLLDGAGSR